VGEVVGVQQNTDAPNVRHRLLDEFQPFRIQLWEKEGRSCDVSARACDTLYKASGHGIAGYSHDDGNCCSRPLGCKAPRGTMRHDNPYVEANKLGGKLRQVLVFAFSPSVLNYDILPLGISEIAQPLPERIEMLREVTRGDRTQKSDASDLLWLLGARGERPGH
jgi:hypothetical protein